MRELGVMCANLPFPVLFPSLASTLVNVIFNGMCVLGCFLSLFSFFLRHAQNLQKIQYFLAAAATATAKSAAASTATVAPPWLTTCGRGRCRRFGRGRSFCCLDGVVSAWEG